MTETFHHVNNLAALSHIANELDAIAAENAHHVSDSFQRDDLMREGNDRINWASLELRRAIRCYGWAIRETGGE